jgi:glycosyltransferase involved in cell wall biosynthesis
VSRLLRLAVVCREPFPNGMAATSRIRLVALALVERGHQASVLIPRVTERPPVVRNQEPSGDWRGVGFLYTTGTTVRPASFLVRRFLELKGFMGAAAWLRRQGGEGGVDCVYLWGSSGRLQPYGVAIRILLRVLRIPFVIEVNELTWALLEDRSLAERLFSPLLGARGAICISLFLERWADEWSRRQSKRFEILRMPILADPEEPPSADLPLAEPAQVLWAASPAYREELRLVLDAMEVVWQSRPECKLVIAGWGMDDPRTGDLPSQVASVSRPENVILVGTLPRPQLLAAYTASAALLAPLVAGPSSEARFPTKIGEYLLSGRPVVTVDIGETGRVLKDGLNAFVAPNADASAFAAAVLRAIRTDGQGTSVGERGRVFAINEFGYPRWAERLEQFFTACARST